MKITVYYDYICPFCFIGTRRIEILAKEFNIENVEWKGIEIHPEIPPQGIKRAKTLRLKQTLQNISEMGEEDNVPIKLPEKVANSRLALEASEFAKTRGKFTEFHTSIYEAYFQGGENIGSRNTILKIGGRSGLKIRELEECLNGRTFRKKIEEHKQEAEKSLVLGVPTFLFGQFRLHGVQSIETFRNIINRAIERQQK
jgi:predicted DsbA family dithiol-disulfide isomerase